MIQIFEGKSPQVHETAFIAPDTVLIGDVSIGENSSVWFKSVLRADINHIKVGDESNIQDGCLLHVTKKYSLSIGNRVTVGHGAILHGCKIGNECLIAMGAIILDGASIGDNVLLGAGALVPPGMQVPDGSLVLGSPAKVVRSLQADDYERIKQGWQNYIDYAGRYARELNS